MCCVVSVNDIVYYLLSLIDSITVAGVNLLSFRDVAYELGGMIYSTINIHRSNAVVKLLHQCFNKLIEGFFCCCFAVDCTFGQIL